MLSPRALRFIYIFCEALLILKDIMQNITDDQGQFQLIVNIIERRKIVDDISSNNLTPLAVFAAFLAFFSPLS